MKKEKHPMYRLLLLFFFLLLILGVLLFVYGLSLDENALILGPGRSI